MTDNSFNRPECKAATRRSAFSVISVKYSKDRESDLVWEITVSTSVEDTEVWDFGDLKIPELTILGQNMWTNAHINAVYQTINTLNPWHSRK